ncbi:MAG TPA: sigma-54 dependent transcriptional regulator [Gemmatimonadaceae bacterium]
MSGPSVLVVDDERTLARSIKAYLTESGYEAEVAADAEHALDLLATLRPDVVFADLRLPGMSGITLMQRIHEFDRAIPVIIMTAFGTIEGAVEAVKLGAFDYLKKPVDLEELRLLADRARETSLLKHELSYHRKRAAADPHFAQLVGESPPMRAVRDRARQVAALEDTPPVLITGETGTGKGLLARTIHASGRLSSKPFIELTCTALPANLIEAELFGYERGAFTDAKESKIGLFEAAEGGTLFLDEVGDVETALQGKLLRAVEEGVVRRVGGLRDRRVNVHIIAATNRDLERDVQTGNFRKDLFFRLAVIVLHLPPLRERGDDIALLADRFLARFTAKYGKDVRSIDPDARAAMLGYPWPGNVRELSHVIERAVLWSQGPTLEMSHLSLMNTVAPPAIRQSEIDVTADRTDAPALPPDGVELSQWERSLIEQALHEAGGNQTKAAQRLGISRDTLRYRLKKFGL